MFEDEEVWLSFWRTIQFALISLPVHLGSALFIALLLNSKHVIGKSMYRTLFYMPTMIPLVATVLIWSGVLNEQTGWINVIIEKLTGFDATGHNGLRWLADPDLVYIAYTMLGLWGIGNAMIVFLAGLQGVPSELYEAAEIDGANWWQKLYKITIPMVTPVIFYQLVLGVIGALQYFLVPFVLNGGSGFPEGKTRFYMIYFYKQAFAFFNMGYAATLAWLMFIVALVITIILFGSARYWVFMRQRSGKMAAESGTYTTEQERAQVYAQPRFSKRTREWLLNVFLTGATLILLVAFLIPMAYGVTTALKTNNQITETGAPWWPALARTFEYEGKEYEVYLVPIDGNVKRMALYKKGRKASLLIDIENPEQGPIEWEGNWRKLKRDWVFAPQWQNFKHAWDTIDFPLLLRNTLMYAGITTFGAVMSASLVAYGFARFRIPGKQILFMMMLSTVILPGAVTLIPTYYVFFRIGWVGTWKPLIIPTFFSWGTNVFLLRQFFLTIPRDLDEAAMIDGANPLRIFLSIILPMSKPALTAVALFHFFWAWNDFFGPLIYLAGNPDKYPITVGLTEFNNLYSQSTNLIQAASLISAVIPLMVFFFAQRVFMQGVVMTGVEK